MYTCSCTSLFLTACLIATFVVAQDSYAAPPSATLGVFKDNGLILPGTITKKKANNSASMITGLKPVQIPGTPAMIPGLGNLPLKPLPGGGAGNDGGGNGGGNPPAKPDWMDIVNGIGGILNGGAHGPGPHPGHHPGHYPGYHPGYTPSYPTSGSGASYLPSNPVPEMPTDTGMSVIVTNPEKNGAPISFVAGGQYFTLAPGYQQVVRQWGGVEVRFDRGGSFGTARYTLQNGTFQFLVTDEGWNLFRKVYRITLDNRENPFSFKYMVGNTIHEVPAGSTREYEQDAPLVVTFDPGTGKAATRTLDSGIYHIAVNPEQRLWDLQAVDTEAALPGVASNLPPSTPLPMGM